MPLVPEDPQPQSALGIPCLAVDLPSAQSVGVPQSPCSTKPLPVIF